MTAAGTGAMPCPLSRQVTDFGLAKAIPAGSAEGASLSTVFETINPRWAVSARALRMPASGPRHLAADGWMKPLGHAPACLCSGGKRAHICHPAPAVQAPEVLEGQGAGTAADVYGFAVVM